MKARIRIENNGSDINLKYFIVVEKLYDDDDDVMQTNFYDIDIAKFLGIDIDDYRLIMEKFNKDDEEDEDGDGEIFFNNLEDCQKAVNYLHENMDSFLVAKELAGDNDV